MGASRTRAERAYSPLFRREEIENETVSAIAAPSGQVAGGQAPRNGAARSRWRWCGLFRSNTPGMDHFCCTVDGYDAQGAMSKCEGVGLNPRPEEDRVYFDDPDGLEVQCWRFSRPSPTGRYVEDLAQDVDGRGGP